MTLTAIAPRTQRIDHLDGLRGAAAAIVVVYHFCAAFLPHLAAGETPNLALLADTPFAIFYNGPFSVAVFFVLSGFVVSGSAAKRQQPLWLSLVLRYARLALPAAASVIFAWFLLSLCPDAIASLRTLMPHPWLQWTYSGHIPGLSVAFIDGFYGIFRHGGSLFNNVLWTMKIELIGSWTIYVIYALSKGKLRIFLLIFMGSAAIFYKFYYEGFVFGALLREASIVERWRIGRPVLAVSVFAVGIFLGAQGPGYGERMGLPALPHFLTLGEPDGLIYPLAAAMIVYGCLYAPGLPRLFGCTPVRFLGRISFALYLVHVPLLCTVFASIVIWLWPLNASEWGGLAFAFLAVSASLAYAATKMIDEPVLRVIARFRRAAQLHVSTMRHVQLVGEGAEISKVQSGSG